MDRNTVIVLAEREESVALLMGGIEPGFELVAHTTEPGELAALVRAHAPAALLVQLEEKGDLLLDAVEALPEPRLPMIVTGPEDQGRLILRAVRIGAHEYVPAGSEGSALRQALAGALGRDASEMPAAAQAPVIAVLGCKGGTGSTLVATQLAVSLQQLGGRTALVDLDLRHGDVSLYLDSHPPYGLADVARPESAVDANYLENVLQAHPSGIRLLAAPLQPEEAELIAARPLGHVLRLVRESHDWVVLDVSRDFGDVTLTALDMADEILLVTEPHIPALHHTRRLLALLERLDRPLSHVRVVVNRCGKDAAVNERDIAEFLSRPSDFRIPNDYSAAGESVSYGRALAEAAPESPLNQAFGELATRIHEWCDRPLPKQPAAKSGLARIGAWLRGRLHGAD